MRGGIDRLSHAADLGPAGAEKHDAAAEALIAGRLSAFKLGQRDHDAMFPESDWREFRRQMAEAIGRLRAD